MSGGSDATRSLAASLAPRLIETCEDRLSDITWFKTDWQRGGAATGHATWTDENGRHDNVVVKLPVVQRELLWTERLQAPASNAHADNPPEPVVPQLYASGRSIDDYDLAWIVIEKFDHGPLGLKWNENHIPRLARAVARFHHDAAAYPVDQRPRIEDWHDLVAEAVESVRVNPINEQKAWQKALKKFRKMLDPLVEQWCDRPTNEWLHGDAHLANAMSRTSFDDGEVTLIDMAEVHAGHWIEDTIYLERQLWARPDRLKATKPVKAVAAARRELGLPVEDEYPRLAMVRRALLAATAPKFIRSEGNPKHLDACLAWLETAMKELK